MNSSTSELVLATNKRTDKLVCVSIRTKSFYSSDTPSYDGQHTSQHQFNWNNLYFVFETQTYMKYKLTALMTQSLWKKKFFCLLDRASSW